MPSKLQQKAILISTILASSMAFIDSTALNVALPAIQEDLQMTGTSLLWVVNGYTLFLSALLLTGGSLGDIYGRKKVFLTGIVTFSIASIACGLSYSPIMLVISRCLQGVGGALMVPGSLSIISALFPVEKRGRAIGTWSMFSALTTVFGPVLGGWLAGADLWRLVFFINVPLAATAIFFLIKYVPESREASARKPDLAGALLATIALCALTYGFIEASEFTFANPVIITAISTGLLFLAAFIVYEKRISHPMMPPELFRSRTFTAANVITLLIYGALGSFLFFFPLNLIQVQGYPAEVAGLTLVPFGLLIAFLSRWAGAWADRSGIKTPLIIGPVLVTAGFFMFSLPGLTAGPEEFRTTFLIPLLLLGAGMGITVAPLTTAVMNSVPKERTGTASGVNNTISRTATVLAIAVIGALGVIRFEMSMLAETDSLKLSAQAQTELLEEMKKLAEATPPETATEPQQQAIKTAIKYSFIDTFRQSALIASILSGLAVFIARFFLKTKPKRAGSS